MFFFADYSMNLSFVGCFMLAINNMISYMKTFISEGLKWEGNTRYMHGVLGTMSRLLIGSRGRVLVGVRMYLSRSSRSITNLECRKWVSEIVVPNKSQYWTVWKMVIEHVLNFRKKVPNWKGFLPSTTVRQKHTSAPYVFRWGLEPPVPRFLRFDSTVLIQW